MAISAQKIYSAVCCAPPKIHTKPKPVNNPSRNPLPMVPSFLLPSRSVFSLLILEMDIFFDHIEVLFESI